MIKCLPDSTECWSSRKLSPVLFALFLNDLESFLCDKSSNGVNFEFQYDDITLYLKLLVLLYADDTVVLVEMRRNFIII